MAFSFLKSFLSAFQKPSKKQGESLTEYLAMLPESVTAQAAAELAHEDAWLLSEEEKQQALREHVAEMGIPVDESQLPPGTTIHEIAQDIDPREGFLRYKQWLFATRSHHVGAMRYDGPTLTLTVVYDRGDTWEYDPIDMNLAEKFAMELIDGSPGTAVWDYLRWRPREGAPDMVSHREWINARMIAAPGPDAEQRPRNETY